MTARRLTRQDRTTLDLSEEEVTGIVERAFLEEPKTTVAVRNATPPSGISAQTYSDIEVVTTAMRALLRRYDGEARRIVRGALFTAMGDD
jgi:hypothetical protein